MKLPPGHYGLRSTLRRLVLRWRTRKLGLRYVFSNAYGHYALTRDNQVVLLSDPIFKAYEQPLCPLLVEGHLQRVAYILAAHQDPRLVHLIPARGPADTTCTDCGGSGRMENPPEDLLRRGPFPCYSAGAGCPYPCYCAGVGWLPDGQGPFEFQ